MSTAKAKTLNIEHLHSSRKDEFMELCLPGPTVNTLAYLDVKFILSYPCFVHDVLLINVATMLHAWFQILVLLIAQYLSPHEAAVKELRLVHSHTRCTITKAYMRELANRPGFDQPHP